MGPFVFVQLDFEDSSGIFRAFGILWGRSNFICFSIYDFLCVSNWAMRLLGHFLPHPTRSPTVAHFFSWFPKLGTPFSWTNYLNYGRMMAHANCLKWMAKLEGTFHHFIMTW